MATTMPSQRFRSPSRARATVAQATQVIRALWRATGDELVGLGPAPMRRGTFRMITLGLVHTANLDLLFGAPLRFDADKAALHFDVALLDAPVMQNQESLEMFIAHSPEGSSGMRRSSA